jgi:regulator of RNase E activity RraA
VNVPDNPQPHVSPETLALLRVPSTATLTTVLGHHGLRNTFMDGVRPLRPDFRLVGLAFTLRYIPAREDLDVIGEVDNLTDPQRVGIEQIGPGEVLVIDARGDTRAGTLGAILATRLHVRRAAGIVTDGAYRDSPAIAEIGIPAYAAAMNAHTNKSIHHPADIQLPVACGGVAVYPGDVLVGDGEGVVVIPRHLARPVAEAAAEMEEKEGFIMRKIQGGAGLAGVYPPDKDTLAEYDAARRRK